MRFNKTNRIIFGLISAVILSQQSPGFGVESPQNVDSEKQIQNVVNQVSSTNEIKDNSIPATIKSNVKSLNSSDLQSLRKQLLQNRETTKSFEDKVLNMESEFNAFPEKARTNLILRDIDVASVLRILAKEGGKNIVLDESVQGVINADLRNISLNEAMRAILTSQELEARVEGHTLFIASRPAMARKGLNRKFIKAFKLNNSNAVEIAKILEASVFNKGYKVEESGSTAMQATTQSQTGSDASGQQTPTAVGTSTGQSSLISSKTIRGKVETMDAGAGFNDASKLASQIKIQSRTGTIQDISINNNDGGAIVIPDTRTNSVLVAGLQQDIMLAQETIKYLDKPLPQVSIEVSLIELTKTDDNDLGLLMSGQAGSFSSGFNSTSLNTGLATLADQAGIMLSTTQSISKEFGARLNALIKTNKAKVLANPTVLALDGSESLVKITDQIVSKMSVTVEPTTGVVTYDPELADIGIVLNIFPKVSDDGFVTMRIRPSITSLLKELPLGPNGDRGYASLISTREVILQDTRVKSGETLAIAGLIKESDLETISKIPFVGDLPILGPLFRNKTLDHTKTELVILITPRIVDDIAYN